VCWKTSCYPPIPAARATEPEKRAPNLIAFSTSRQSWRQGGMALGRRLNAPPLPEP
jgi:hypothetical protein